MHCIASSSVHLAACYDASPQMLHPKSAAVRADPPAGGKRYDFSGETMHFESPPHRGDLAFNVVLAATILWLPLTIAAIGRAAFVKYK